MRTKQPSLLSLQNKGRSTGPLFRVLLTAFFFLSTASQAWAGNQFVRGDANGDGAVDISDGIATLQYLFSCGEDCPMVCDDAADFDDNGAIEITDAILTFGFLFQGAAAPVAPYSEPGEDSTEDELTCGSEGGVLQVAAGKYHTCAILESGAYCWGDNRWGQLGDGSEDIGGLPVPVVLPVRVAFEGPVDQIVTGQNHTCLLSEGTVWCSGENEHGQLGDGSVEDKRAPVAVTDLTDAVQIAAGWTHTCAILGDGTAKCWGRNQRGQLGTGDFDDQLSPVLVEGLSDATDISLGELHSCAIAGDGVASCWGFERYNATGLGSASYSHVTVPEPVVGLPEVEKSIACGRSSSCAHTADGAVWCWGTNYQGNFGYGSLGIHVDEQPVQAVDSPPFDSIELGANHSCGVTEDGSLYCWGAGSHGQIGDGLATARQQRPALVDGLENVVQVSAGQEHTCAISSTQGLWCWGYNYHGQLGDNTEETRLTPVPVVFPSE